MLVNGLEIVQGAGYVAIRTEAIDEARIVPVDGRPHVGAAIKTYMGDSRGRWDGRTLGRRTSSKTLFPTIGFVISRFLRQQL
jgi:hypothetical protein